MSLGSIPGKWWIISLLGGTLLAGSLLGGAQAPNAAPTAEKDAYHTALFTGSSTCIRCHVIPQGAGSENYVLLNEYVTWRLSDKHSLAYLALAGSRGTRMGELLGQDVKKSETGCMNCHTLNFPDRFKKDGLDDALKTTELLSEGVSCESCHGPAEKWIGPHFDTTWRGKTPQQKYELGMYDVRNPVERSKLCVSCHIGKADEGKVVTHAMYAAGHPPLPSIEIATFSDQMPHHWRLPADVPFFQGLAQRVQAGTATPAQKNILDLYHFSDAKTFQSQLVLSTSLLTLQAELKLVADRSNFQHAGAARLRVWPELGMKEFAGSQPPSLWPQLALAHSDCLGCHHELRPAGWRQVRGYTGAPGRPQIEPWPLTLTARGVGLDLTARKDLPSKMEPLTTACNRQPFGAPDALHKSAAAAERWLDHQLLASNVREEAKESLAILRLLCSVPLNDYPNYDSARQLAAAIEVVYADFVKIKAITADDEIRKSFAAWNEQFELPDPGRKDHYVSADQARIERRKLLIRALYQQQKPADTKLQSALDYFAEHGIVESKDSADKESKAFAEAIEPFLRIMVKATDGSTLNLALLQEKNQELLLQLESINEKQNAAMLNKMRAYDPQQFMATLKKIADRLPAP